MRIERLDSAPAGAVATIERGLVEHARERGIEPRNHRELAIVMYDDGGAIVGGLLGVTVWGWLHVTDLWVAAALRGRGWGSRILEHAEQSALERGCHHALLDTFDFQALDFYRRSGYEVFGELEDFPTGHVRHFVRKRLGR